MLTKGFEVMKYIKASAGRANLNVVWENVNQPRHDGKTIYLPRITINTTDDDLKELMASTDHEVGHDRFSCFDVLKEKGLTSMSRLGFIWNFVEDARVNNIEAREYEGFRELWDEVIPKLIKSIAEKKEENPMQELMLSLMKWEGKAFSLFPVASLTSSKLVTNNKIDEVLTPFTKELQDVSYILDKREGSEATYALAEKLFKALGGDLEKELEEQKALQELMKKGKGAREAAAELTGEGKEAADKETESSKDGKEGDGETSRSDKWEIIKVSLKDVIDAPTMTSTIEQRMSHTGIDCDTRTDCYDWDLTPFDEFCVINFPQQKLIGIPYSTYDPLASESRHFIYDYNSYLSGKDMPAENFANQVRRLIQIRAKSKTEYGTKKGKLDQSRLARLCAKTPGFSERIFKRKYENNTLDSCVTVLMDCSGSMSGEKMVYASEASLLLNHTFRVLGISFELLGFTDTPTGTPIMFVYKEFNGVNPNNDTVLEYIAKSSNYMCGNPDGENLLWAYDRIIKRKEKRKLLLVLSDGSPAASRGMSGCNEFLTRTVKEIEQAKKVELYGIGLCSGAVKYYYTNRSVINSPEEIPIKILEVIERKLLND